MNNLYITIKKTMKNLIFVLAVVLVGCTKVDYAQDIGRVKCPQIDYEDFTGFWSWHSVNQGNGWDTLNMGALQDIEITDSLIRYVNFAPYTEAYVDNGCSVITWNGGKQYQVYIESDTLHLTQLDNLYKWKLVK